jgi:hypothetical protein
MFVDPIDGTAPVITFDNMRDLWLLSDEFNFAVLSIAIAAWRAVPRPLDADMRLIAVPVARSGRPSV